MNIKDLHAICEKLITKGHGDKDAYISIWNDKDTNYLINFPIHNQVIGNDKAVMIGCADNCMAHMLMDTVQKIDEI